MSYLDGNGNPQGVVFDVVNILKEKYGFNYTVKMPKQNIIGDADTGIISMVHKKVSATTGGSVLEDSSRWDVTPYRLTNNYRSFGEAHHRHIYSQGVPGDRNIQTGLNLHDHSCVDHSTSVSR